MAKTEAEKMMEISWEYKNGLRNLDQAITKMMNVTGLNRDLSEQFLRGLNRDNIMRVDFSKKTRNGREARRIGAGPKID